jgi:hypothetical protein
MPAIAQLLSCKTIHCYRIVLRKWRRIIAVSAIVSFWASAANADVLLFSANTKQQNFNSPSGTGSAFVDLNGSGVTQLSFATSQPNQRVLITFSAGCIMVGPNGTALDAGFFSGVNILVNPAGPVGEIAVPPTNAPPIGALLCQGVGTAHDGGASTIVASARPAQAGTHTVRVRAIFGPRGTSTSAATLSLADTSLAVTR